jgi:DNA-directed RNA polymerase specialized sigma24 family protein
VKTFDKDGANSHRWEWMNPDNPLFAITFPRVAEQAAIENWPRNKTIQRAIDELRREVRSILFPSFRKDDIVDEIVSELLVRVGEECPFGCIDAKRGDGRGFFRVFLTRRVVKEINRHVKKRQSMTLDDVDQVIPARQPDGITEESREMFARINRWIPLLPPMQGRALAKWMKIQARSSGGANAPIPLSRNERTNLCRAVEALRKRAEENGMMN